MVTTTGRECLVPRSENHQPDLRGSQVDRHSVIDA